MGKTGSCRLIFGPMFSGKTTQLLKELTTCADVGMKCLYINHQLDNRITDNSNSNHKVSTHHSQFKQLSPKISTTKTNKLSDLEINNFQVIGIDEGQFFPDLEVTVRKWVLDNKKTVIVASLDADFDIKPFGQGKELICLCESIVKLSAICQQCLINSPDHIQMIPAYFSKRLSDEKEQVVVGGSAKYQAVCLKCYQTK